MVRIQSIRLFQVILILVVMSLTSCSQPQLHEYTIEFAAFATRPLDINYNVGGKTEFLDSVEMQSAFTKEFFSPEDTDAFSFTMVNSLSGCLDMATYTGTGTATKDSCRDDFTTEITITVPHDAAHDAIAGGLGYFILEDAGGRTYIIRSYNKTTGVAVIDDPGNYFREGTCTLADIGEVSLTASRVSHASSRTVMNVSSTSGLDVGDFLYCDDFPVITGGGGPSYNLLMPDGSTTTGNRIDGSTSFSVGDTASSNRFWFRISAITSPTQIEVEDPDGLWDYGSDGLGDGTFFDDIVGGNASQLSWSVSRNGHVIDSGYRDSTSIDDSDGLSLIHSHW